MSDERTAQVPNYVTVTGYAEEISTRIKVGDSLDAQRVGILDVASGEHGWAELDLEDREVSIGGAIWSPDSRYLLANVRALDNKDRWLAVLQVREQAEAAPPEPATDDAEEAGAAPPRLPPTTAKVRGPKTPTRPGLTAASPSRSSWSPTITTRRGSTGRSRGDTAGFLTARRSTSSPSAVARCTCTPSRRAAATPAR